MQNSLPAVQLWPPHGAEDRIAFPLCTAIEMRCIRYSWLQGSSVVLHRRWPSSPTNSSAVLSSTQDVSTAKDTKKWLESKCPYLANFTLSTCMCSHSSSPSHGSGNVGGRVNRCLGMWYPRRAPSHSSTVQWNICQAVFHRTYRARDGMLAEVRDLWMASFIDAWRECLPSLHRQLRPWVARWSTSAPQWMHCCGLQREVPSLRPTATQVVSSK